MIKRRKARGVRIGSVKIGGGAPVSIQSMTKAETRDVRSVISQIEALQDAGCEIVRVAVKTREDIAALPEIKSAIRIPLVADIHFNHRLALGAIANGADAIRLNPGNIRRRRDIREVARSAKRAGIAVRIGVNSGSLRSRGRMKEERFMVQSALGCIKYFEGLKFYDIIVSLKSSNVLTTIRAYRRMAALCDYPFHLGVTATGFREDGIVKSAVGIGALLCEGIGDTVRVSLTADPLLEVETAKSILQALRIRSFGYEIVSCPSCGRCHADIESIVEALKKAVRYRSCGIRKRPLTIAVMGCEVNGPGEARGASVGIAAGKGSGLLFEKGRIVKRIRERDFVKEILKKL